MSSGARVLILGANGQLGTELQRSFASDYSLVPLGREALDLALPENIQDAIQRIQPQVILNAAAYTAVDRAESETEQAFAINARAPRMLADAAADSNALLVHYSTDYVFDGNKDEPWTEDDPPNPVNAYGASKLAGEEAIHQIGGRYLIFRTSWVYGPHGKNFLLTMLRLGRERERLTIVDDQFGAPTTSIDLARATRLIVDGVLAGRHGAAPEWAGIYHVTCAGSTTWRRFAEAIFDRAGSLIERRPQVIPIPSSEFPTPAKRPRNSVLSNAKLTEQFGVQLATWESALDEVMAELRRP